MITTNNGTSFSSPIIAGAMASFWQAVPSATNEEIKQLVRASASQFNTPDFFLGFGIPNMSSALTEALSLQEQEFDALKVFPNPITDKVTIQLPQGVNSANLKIYNVIGKLVLETELSRSESRLDLSELNSGIYILSVEIDTASKQLKIIKS